MHDLQKSNEGGEHEIQNAEPADEEGGEEENNNY